MKVYFLKNQSELSYWHSSKVKLFHVISITDSHSAGFFYTGRITTLNKIATESKTMHPGQGYDAADGFTARQLLGRNAA